MAGSNTVEYCAQHATVGMVNVKKGKGRTEGCRKGPYFGVAGTKTANCSRHAPDRIVNFHSRKCRTEGCAEIPSFGVDGTRMAKYCSQHALDGMVNIHHRKCITEGCGNLSFAVASSKATEYCAKHALVGMVDVMNRKGRTEGCDKQPSFGVEGTKTVEYCAPFGPNGMVGACSRNGTTGGCGKQPLFGVANTGTAQYCAQHARLKCGDEGYREGEVDPHYCEKEIIGNINQSGGKHTAVHPLLPQASLPSGGTQASRKRARHQDITSTGSKRAAARDSTGRAVIMPDIEEQKSPVTRDSFMKTEVQIFW